MPPLGIDRLARGPEQTRAIVGVGTRQGRRVALDQIGPVHVEPQFEAGGQVHLIAGLQIDALGLGGADVDVRLDDVAAGGDRIARQAEGVRLPDDLAAIEGIALIQAAGQDDVRRNRVDLAIHLDIPPVDAAGQARRHGGRVAQLVRARHS